MDCSGCGRTARAAAAACSSTRASEGVRSISGERRGGLIGKPGGGSGSCPSSRQIRCTASRNLGSGAGRDIGVGTGGSSPRAATSRSSGRAHEGSRPPNCWMTNSVQPSSRACWVSGVGVTVSAPSSKRRSVARTRRPRTDRSRRVYRTSIPGGTTLRAGTRTDRSSGTADQAVNLSGPLDQAAHQRGCFRVASHCLRHPPFDQEVELIGERRGHCSLPMWTCWPYRTSMHPASMWTLTMWWSGSSGLSPSSRIACR